MPTTEASGTQTATVGTEHSLDTETTANVLILTVDTNSMGIGDVIELKVKQRVLTGGTNRLAYAVAHRHAQSDPIKMSIPVASMFNCEFTLKHAEANFTITSMTGTVGLGATVTGATSGAVGTVIHLDDLATPTLAVIRVTSGTFQDAENAEVDGSNYLVLNDATPALTFPWSVVSL